MIRLSVAFAAMGATAFAPWARADQIDDHDALVRKFVTQQHASPLTADCAAHAAFVVPTSPRYDHVDFLSTALDSEHASIEPWNKPFDNRKQRITVDNLVTVNGLAYRKPGDAAQPDLIVLRCGYVADKLLAFSYAVADVGGPAPEAEPVVHSSSRRVVTGRHGKRTVVTRHTTSTHHGSSKHSASAHTGKNKTSGKTSGKASNKHAKRK